MRARFALALALARPATHRSDIHLPETSHVIEARNSTNGENI
jgi:hypothetical protein